MVMQADLNEHIKKPGIVRSGLNCIWGLALVVLD
jgi:hypothetical protein